MTDVNWKAYRSIVDILAWTQRHPRILEMRRQMSYTVGQLQIAYARRGSSFCWFPVLSARSKPTGHNGNFCCQMSNQRRLTLNVRRKAERMNEYDVDGLRSLRPSTTNITANAALTSFARRQRLVTAAQAEYPAKGYRSLSAKPIRPNQTCF